MNEKVIQTYVWHQDKAFFVSTIERDCSAISYPIRYNETFVWECDPKTCIRGEFVGQGEADAGSIHRHQEIVQSLYDNGTIDPAEESA